MTPTLVATVLDTPGPRALGAFYHRLPGWPVDDDEDWVTLRPPGGGAGLSFQREPLHVAPAWPAVGGVPLTQVHLDLLVDDLDAAVAAAVAAGASVEAHQPQEHVRVRRDPHGHLFCLFRE